MIIPYVSGSLLKYSRQSIKLVPFNGSPPIPITKDYPNPFKVVWFTAS